MVDNAAAGHSRLQLEIGVEHDQIGIHAGSQVTLRAQAEHRAGVREHKIEASTSDRPNLRTALRERLNMRQGAARERIVGRAPHPTVGGHLHLNAGV